MHEIEKKKLPAGVRAQCLTSRSPRRPRHRRRSHDTTTSGGRWSSLPTSRLSPAARSSGRLAAAHRNRRRCRLARTRPEKPVRTPGGSGRLGCSRFSRRPPIAPGSPRPTSPFPTIVLPMFGARHRTLAPIRGLRPADAGVCASRSGGGTSDNRTLPEIVRNGAHLQTFLTGQSLQGQSPPRMLCLLDYIIVLGQPLEITYFIKQS